MNIYQQEARERREWRLGSIILTLITAALFTFALGSCRPDEVKTYNAAKAKYAKEFVDTTYQTVEVTVPRDSVVTTFKTDTTHYVERVRQGRATLTIIREPTNTTVIANCDSASRKERVIVQTVTQKWGVDPKYQTWFKICFTIMGILLFVIVLAILVGVFFRYFSGFTIQRRQPNGNDTQTLG